MAGAREPAGWCTGRVGICHYRFGTQCAFVTHVVPQPVRPRVSGGLNHSQGKWQGVGWRFGVVVLSLEFVGHRVCWDSSFSSMP